MATASHVAMQVPRPQKRTAANFYENVPLSLETRVQDRPRRNRADILDATAFDWRHGPRLLSQLPRAQSAGSPRSIAGFVFCALVADDMAARVKRVDVESAAKIHADRTIHFPSVASAQNLPQYWDRSRHSASKIWSIIAWSQTLAHEEFVEPPRTISAARPDVGEAFP